MIDTRNPNEQFHSYQSPDFTPVSDGVHSGDSPMKSGLSSILEKVGITPSSMSSMKNSWNSSLNNVQVNETVTKARQYAAANPGKVLGGLAAMVIGAGMLRSRAR